MKKFSLKTRSRVEESSEDRHALQTDGTAARPERDKDDRSELSPLAERDKERRPDSR